MLRLYKNKFQTFECTVDIEGADSSEAFSRIILYPKNDTRNIMYEGVVVDNKVEVDINSNINVAKEGRVVLEIIVDNSLIFTPWEDIYEVVDQVKIDQASINYHDKSRVMPRVTVRNVPDSTTETSKVRLAGTGMRKVASKVKAKLAPPKEASPKEAPKKKVTAKIISNDNPEAKKTASKQSLTREESVAKLKGMKNLSTLNIFEEFGG